MRYPSKCRDAEVNGIEPALDLLARTSHRIVAVRLVDANASDSAYSTIWTRCTRQLHHEWEMLLRTSCDDALHRCQIQSLLHLLVDLKRSIPTEEQSSADACELHRLLNASAMGSKHNAAVMLVGF